MDLPHCCSGQGQDGLSEPGCLGQGGVCWGLSQRAGQQHQRDGGFGHVRGRMDADWEGRVRVPSALMPQTQRVWVGAPELRGARPRTPGQTEARAGGRALGAQALEVRDGARGLPANGGPV